MNAQKNPADELGAGGLFLTGMEIEIGKIGIVVCDAGKTARNYSEMLQLGPWSFYDLDPSLTVLQDKQVENDKFGVRVATNILGRTRIELLQPLYGSSSYEAFFRKYGEGIHHISFGQVEEYDHVVTSMGTYGIGIEMQGQVEGSHSFTQFESQQDLGIIFEVTQSVQSDITPWGTYQPQDVGWVNTDEKRIAQIGIVVDDAGKMARRYWELFGIGPWYFFDIKTPGEVFHNISIQPETDSHFRIAIADHPSIQFELIEPVLGPGTHMDYLRRHGIGTHHMSFDIIQDFDEVVATMALHGIEIEMSGFAGPAYRYTYFSTQPKLGTILEVLKFYPEADEMAGLYEVYPPEKEKPRPADLE